MHILGLPYNLERSIEIKLRFPHLLQQPHHVSNFPWWILGCWALREKRSCWVKQKKMRVAWKKATKKLGLQRRVQPQSQTLDCLPKTLGMFVYLHAIISNTFGPDSIPFLLLPVVLPCASLAVRGPSKMHQILIWLPLPPATLAESSFRQPLLPLAATLFCESCKKPSGILSHEKHPLIIIPT